MIGDKNKLSIAYINDRGEQKKCIREKGFAFLAIPGHLGVTARNVKKEDKNMDVSLKSIQMTNFHPERYTKGHELFTEDEHKKAELDKMALKESLGFTEEQFLEELVSGDQAVIFTEELQADAADLLANYHAHVDALNKYI